jgi:hypothetical protein
MKFNKSNFYTTLFIVLVLSQIYVPSFKFNIFFQLIVLSLFIFFEKPHISIKFLKNCTPLFFIFGLGFLGMILFKRPIGLALKDIFHIIKPIQGILIGYFFYQVINNQKLFYKSIIKVAFVSAVIHLLIVFIFTDFSSGSIHVIREYTRDNYFELFAFFFLLYYKRFRGENLFESKKNRQIIFLVLLISIIIYFSRTMIVASIIILFSVYGYTKITIKSLKIIFTLVVSTIVLYSYLYSVNINREGSGLEGFLYKIKIAPEEIFKTKIDRENHQELWDHWRGYEAKRAFALMNDSPITYLTGTGYGSLVNLKFKAPLNGEKKGMKYISELHNGYSYLLYKTGFFALILYVLFLFSLYFKVYQGFTFETVFISAIALFYFFTTLTITGIYNTNDTIVFLLGALLYENIKSRKKVAL